MASLGSKLRFLATAGVGFFADGYLNLTIGLVVPILGYLYFQGNEGSVPAVDSDIMKGGLSLGMVVGQLAFGVLGDAWGRHTIYGRELLITIFGTLLVILMPWKNMSPSAVTAWVAVWRVVTGVGTGADYPLSSSLSAEKAPLGSRAVQVLTVFSNIGLGNFSASIVFLVLLRAFQGAITSKLDRLQWVWRLQLGIGIVPAALTLYARLTIGETSPYQHYVADQGAGRKRGLKEQWADFHDYFKEWRHARVLFATSAAWFLFDIAYYGLNLNQSIILSRIGYSTGATPWEKLWKMAVGNLIVQAAGYLPGFYVGIFLPDRIGRVRQQFYSSTITCILYAIWAGISAPSAHTSTAGMMVIFAISQFVICAGPNVTTFLIPAEVFPTRVRGTAHGISAAAGKCGAILTAFAFGTVEEAIGLGGILGLFSGIMLLTALVTLMIPETKGQTLAEIERGGMYHASASHSQSTPDIEGMSPSLKAKENVYDHEVTRASVS
ncbi:major facilitator superfamily domain-containing protein [Aspergillus lucknowensis]|uniref:Major facilitator superfamily domain-containing protein n=1 Tax=Aspergillus lucknowensis TaxID=176173 RepID=A0ABR4M5Z4_9EURO